MWATYADNWEILADSTGILLQALPIVEQFWRFVISLLRSKRLGRWLSGPSIVVFCVPRNFLESLCLSNLRLVNWEQMCEVRNLSVSSGHQRLVKLSGLPVPIWKNSRLLLSSIFPHALHAAKATWVPKTTFPRLRTKVSKGLGLALKGSSPYLACLLGTYLCVDPVFVLIVNRLHSFRQMSGSFLSSMQFSCNSLSPLLPVLDARVC